MVAQLAKRSAAGARYSEGASDASAASGAPPSSGAGQLPPVQTPASQTCPHIPQLLGSVIVFVVMQVIPAQQPLVQDVAVHWQSPPMHCCVPAHAWVHVPQFPLSLDRSTQTPVFALVGQNVWPEVVQTQAPMEQLALRGHFRPQPPQLLPSLAPLTSHPVVGMPSQSKKPALHDEIAQAPASPAPWAQVHEALPPMHFLVHPPQLFTSVDSLTHVPPHMARGGPHTHIPPLQVEPVGHGLPHPPQLAGSLAVSTQVLPQRLSVPEHAHRPPAQWVPAGQTWPHVPQFVESVVRSTQAPPVVHMVTTSLPFGLHTHVLLVQSAPTGHLCPHEPQLLGSEVVSTQVITLPTGHWLVVPVHVQTPGG
jgi:hypothetical protein